MPNYNLIQYQKQAILEAMETDDTPRCDCPPEWDCPVHGLRGLGPWYSEALQTYHTRRIFDPPTAEVDEQARAILRAVLRVDNDSIPF